MSSVGASKIVPAMEPAKPFDLSTMSKMKVKICAADLQNQGTKGKGVIRLQHGRFNGNMERDNTTVDVGVHVIRSQLHKTRNTVLRKRAESFNDTNQSSDKLGVANA